MGSHLNIRHFSINDLSLELWPAGSGLVKFDSSRSGLSPLLEILIRPDPKLQIQINEMLRCNPNQTNQSRQIKRNFTRLSRRVIPSFFADSTA